MPDARQLSEISRQELYDLIWSSPATKVAANFGISDVAVHKRCIRLNIPRPSRGYWAKIEAGHKPKKKPLPPSPDEVFAQLAQRPAGKTLALPEKGTPLHPLATELMQSLAKAKRDSQKRVDLREPTLPEVLVSKVMAERVAQAFHLILNGLEPLGIFFRKSQSCYHGGHFRRGNDRLHFFIDETLVDKLGSERRVHSWQWQESGEPSGRLAFTFKTEHYGAGEEKQWTETAKLPLERLIPQIISGLGQHFLNLQKQHAQEAIERKKRLVEAEQRWREYQAKEAIRLQKENEQNHANALKSVAEARKQDLLKAAEWWRLSRAVKEFVDECEKRWKTTSGELSPEQTAWLAWANEIVNTLSPFSAGYPDPLKHGAFDASLVPFGGPYPSAKNFSHPSC